MFFFLNGSEFCQKLIGTIIRVHSPASNNDKDPCHIRAQCVGGGPKDLNIMAKFEQATSKNAEFPDQFLSLIKKEVKYINCD